MGDMEVNKQPSFLSWNPGKKPDDKTADFVDHTTSDKPLATVNESTPVWTPNNSKVKQQIIDGYTKYFKALGLSQPDIDKQITKINNWTLGNIVKASRWIEANKNNKEKIPNDEARQIIISLVPLLRQISQPLIVASLPPALRTSLQNGTTEIMTPENLLVRSNDPLWTDKNAEQKAKVIAVYTAYFKEIGLGQEEIDKQAKKIADWKGSNLLKAIAWIEKNKGDKKVAPNETAQQILSGLLVSLRNLAAGQAKLVNQLSKNEQFLINLAIQAQQEARMAAIQSGQKVPDETAPDISKIPELIKQVGANQRITAWREAQEKIALYEKFDPAGFQHYQAILTLIASNPQFKLYSHNTLQVQEWVSYVESKLDEPTKARLANQAEERAVAYFASRQSVDPSTNALIFEYQELQKQTHDLEGKVKQAEAGLANLDAVVAQVTTQYPNADKAKVRTYFETKFKTALEGTPEKPGLRPQLQALQAALGTKRGALINALKAFKPLVNNTSVSKWDDVLAQNRLQVYWEMTTEAMSYRDPQTYGIPAPLQDLCQVYALSPKNIGDFKSIAEKNIAAQSDPADENMGRLVMAREASGNPALALNEIGWEKESRFVAQLSQGTLPKEEWNALKSNQEYRNSVEAYLGPNAEIIEINGNPVLIRRDNKESQWHPATKGYENYYFKVDEQGRHLKQDLDWQIDPTIAYQEIAKGNDSRRLTPFEGLQRYWKEPLGTLATASLVPSQTIFGDNKPIYMGHKIETDQTTAAALLNLGGRPARGPQEPRWEWAPMSSSSQEIRALINLFGGNLNAQSIREATTFAGATGLPPSPLNVAPNFKAPDYLKSFAQSNGINISDADLEPLRAVLNGEAQIIVRQDPEAAGKK